MRTIDADALREAVESHVTSVSVCATAEQARGRTDFKKLCLKDINEAPTVGGWISVEDELPKLGDMVLFTGLSSFGTRFTTQRGWFDGTFWKRDTGETVYSNTPVTHWMPLPEPPKEGDGR